VETERDRGSADHDREPVPDPRSIRTDHIFINKVH